MCGATLNPLPDGHAPACRSAPRGPWPPRSWENTRTVSTRGSCPSALGHSDNISHKSCESDEAIPLNPLIEAAWEWAANPAFEGRVCEIAEECRRVAEDADDLPEVPHVSRGDQAA